MVTALDSGSQPWLHIEITGKILNYQFLATPTNIFITYSGFGPSIGYFLEAP